MKQIISCSRRTDIPACYYEWLQERLAEKKVTIVNPYNNEPYDVDLTPENIHSIVLWSKNYFNLIKNPGLLNQYNLYFQFTINAYDSVIEPFAPEYDQAISQVEALCATYSPKQVSWRFDPIMFCEEAKWDERLNIFKDLALDMSQLGVDKCTFSFISVYGKVKESLAAKNIKCEEVSDEKKIEFTKEMVKIATPLKIRLYSCCEAVLESVEGINKSHCVDGTILQELFGDKTSKAKDQGQRLTCGCTKSKDIGSYKQPCPNKCVYCLDGESLILMGDGSFKKLKNISIGDTLYGVKKDGSHNKSRYKYCLSKVKSKWTICDKISVKITTSFGEVICSEDHRWLTDRGWKYTMPSKDYQRKYLTTNNIIYGVGYNGNDVVEITDDYKKGYICGIVKGDGTIGHYDYSCRKRSNVVKGKIYFRKTDTSHSFRLALVDECATTRTYNYLNDLGIETYWFDFEITSSTSRKIKAIQTRKYETVLAIEKILSKSIDSIEFKRGFVAGIFDAEGSGNGCLLRISNTNHTILNAIILALKRFGFRCKKEKFKSCLKRENPCYTVIVHGGLSETIRFFNTFNPSIRRKVAFIGKDVKNHSAKILKIEYISEKRKMHDIETECGNFIANGLISHNCYANTSAYTKE